MCGQLEDVEILDTTRFQLHNGNSGMWSLNSTSGGYTTIQLQVFNQKSEYFYSFDEVFNANRLRFPGFTYDFSAGDIDNDGRTELILGNTQFGTNYIEYLDSTGLGPTIMQGYEFKEIITNAPVSAGWNYLKDYDNDGIKEITTCGIGNGSGSIGVVRHTGSPGENNFTTMWWDSTDILASPNYGIDTGSIDNYFNILYTYDFSSGPHFWCYILTYNRTGVYNFQRSSYKYIDSAATLGGLLKDIDLDGKSNVITPIAYSRSDYPFVHLNVFEQTGTIGINQTSSVIPRIIYLLYQNYPNPFNPETVISFEISKATIVRLQVFDITGKEVMTLTDRQHTPGKYNIAFNGKNLNSGIYFYSLLADNKFIGAKK
ncbi:MAG: T9SS type A sorting domain-containing protein [Ignavibacteria bacterium]|nr:T9SS type A sorting domain-containing protein [Ignavibacteria bacterium]